MREATATRKQWKAISEGQNTPVSFWSEILNELINTS